MASSLRRFLKFPRRAKNTEKSSPPHDESQLPVWKSGTRVVASFQYQAVMEDELSFDEGEEFVIEDHISEVGWVMARNSRGVTGLIPSNFVGESKFPAWKRGTKVNALFQYKAVDDDELSFVVGEELVIEDQASECWSIAKNSRGVTGRIPSNYVKEKELFTNDYQVLKANRNNEGENAELFTAEQDAVPEKNASTESNAALVKNAAGTTVWSPGTRVVGNFSFNGQDRMDLPFVKGEILVIDCITRDPKWYRAVNSKGHKGRIPYDYVKKLFPVEPDPMPWFHRNLSREEAERLLNTCEDGVFLIRNSVHYGGDHALSVCYANKVKHYRIRLTADGKLTLGNGVFVRSLSEFVEHYSRDSDGLPTRLAKPVVYEGETFYINIDQRRFEIGGWEINRNCLYSAYCIRSGDYGGKYK